MNRTLDDIRNVKTEDVTPTWVERLQFDTVRGWHGKVGYDEDQVDAMMDAVEERLANLIREAEHWRNAASVSEEHGRPQTHRSPVGDGPVPPSTDETGLLTFTEHRAVECLADLWGLLGNIVGAGRNQRDDLAELVAPVHALQNAILAQAAARAYPNRYRLLGHEVAEVGERCV